MRSVVFVCLAVFVGFLSGCDRGSGGDVVEDVIRLNIRGTAYLGQQNWADAETAFRSALALRADDPLLLDNVAVALIQQGRIDEAAELLQRAVEIEPEHVYSHYNLGLLDKNQGHFEEAATHFEVVARHDPDDLLTQYNLGIVLSRTGSDAGAEAAFRKALELNPTHVSSLYGLGRFLLQKGDQAEGERLVALSQEIRARSGLDEAVGSQYGEQGPYALGVDFPADTLRAPEPGSVSFREAKLDATASPNAVPTRLEPGAVATLVAIDGDRLLALSPAGAREIGTGFAAGTLHGVAAGDLDNDGVVDLVAVTADRLVWWRQDADGAFAAQTAATFATPAPSSLTLADVDHDGDLDLFWCWSGTGAVGCAVAHNDGTGALDAHPSTELGFSIAAPDGASAHVGFSDFDNDRDTDLLVAAGGAVHVFANQRDGTFEETAATPGGALAAVTSMAIADVDKNGWMDLVLAGPDGISLLANRRGKLDVPQRLGDPGGAETVVVLDYDNDGFLDVAATTDQGRALVRNLGGGEWSATTALLPDSANIRVLWSFDADDDGDTDLAGPGGEGSWTFLVNEGGNTNGWIQVDSRGVGDNRFGIGAKVEVLAGALRQKFEVTSPLPVHAGLGSRDRVESVRHLWPSGVLQDEIDRPAGEPAEITQLDRKGTSCPLLYAWRDGGWRFLTDFLGGAAVGYQQAPGVFSIPDTDEYVRIDGGLEPDPDGWLKLRMNNQLEEVLWFDQAQLVVVDHPAGSEVFPNERLMPGPPWPEFRLFVADDVRDVVAARAVDDERDLTEVLRHRDGRSVDNFELLPFKGYAEPHTIELDLGPFPAGQQVVLLLDGWIDYADSSANVAAVQAGYALHPPTLTVADGRGGWVGTDHRMGFPAGLPKTMAVELTGSFSGDDHRVRIATDMRIYWDRARVMVGGEDLPTRVARLAPDVADLRAGGFPRQTSGGRRTPTAYSPDDVAERSNWKAHVGAYTAFGDVSDLLGRIDDRFVTTRNGDEVELRFRAPAPPPAGWTRTYLLFADGFGKDMDPNSAANNEIGPIPFHAMPRYPYPEGVVPPFAQGEGEPPRRWVRPSSRGWPGAVPQPLAGS